MKQNTRYKRLDEIRGLTLISMIFYHFLWDLAYIAGFKIPWYAKLPGKIWQQSICWTFILLSGFCWSFGRHHFKRGLTVFLAGGLVTAVTLIFLPEDRIIFGVLTLIGSAMLLMIPLDKLAKKWLEQKRNAFIACLLLSLILFLQFRKVNDGYLLPLGVAGVQISLPKWLYSGWISTFLGFTKKPFFSTDYFSLIPWFFLFLAGYFLAGYCRSQRTLPSEGSASNKDDEASPITSFLRTTTIPYAEVLGRHSLLIYLLHQPVLYTVTLFIQFLRK